MTKQHKPQAWPPKPGQHVNYYGSKSYCHGAAYIERGPYRLSGSDELHYTIKTPGYRLKHVRTGSLFPLYEPETTRELLTAGWCGYCGYTQQLTKTGRVRVHKSDSERCDGSAQLPRFTVTHHSQTPYQGRPWTVTDNSSSYGGNMCTPDGADKAERDGWFPTYAEARAAATARELEGFTYAGQCVHCITAIETNGSAYRHINHGPECFFRPGVTAEPKPSPTYSAA